MYIAFEIQNGHHLIFVTGAKYKDSVANDVYTDSFAFPRLIYRCA